MDIEEFKILGEKRFSSGWQSEIARRLNVNSRTVRRWASGASPVPDPVAAWLWQGKGYESRVIIGNDCHTDAEMLIYLGAPSFIAKIWIDDGGQEEPIDGVTVALPEGEILYDFVFLQETPDVSKDAWQYAISEIAEALDLSAAHVDAENGY